jgi:hypothetical protein
LETMWTDSKLRVHDGAVRSSLTPDSRLHVQQIHHDSRPRPFPSGEDA